MGSSPTLFLVSSTLSIDLVNGIIWEVRSSSRLFWRLRVAFESSPGLVLLFFSITTVSSLLFPLLLLLSLAFTSLVGRTSFRRFRSFDALTYANAGTSGGTSVYLVDDLLVLIFTS